MRLPGGKHLDDGRPRHRNSASLAATSGKLVRAIDVDALQRKLREAGQIIYLIPGAPESYPGTIDNEA